ncbi:hypothetical protein C7S20_09920 [Christiangramia fulva]|uniref:L,D-TPase catalytic domain-containing protein n=1 Tax=Christiangramia fulva TaxID=2126553 RepID=A0A2R3Z5N5_9FLAO|nr:L,D-transpeptidase family protein [Christiangramia fulva]AVR45558.1 hypothetical protein C7S20_09920 [Christiangramia fulva]
MPNFRNLIHFSIFLFLIAFSGCKNDEEKKEASSTSEEKVTKKAENLTNSHSLQNLFASGIDSTAFYAPAQISAFYRKNEFQPIWNDSQLREDIIANIENSEAKGLFPEDYHASEIRELHNSINSNSDEKNARFEILLTDAFFRLAHDLATGKLNPKELYANWGTPLNSVAPENLLSNVIKKNNVSEILVSLEPENPVYSGLKKALRNFEKDSFSEEKITKIPAGKLIRPGERDERISKVAKRLQELGFHQKSTDTTKLYGEDLEKSLRNFQKAHGLEEDGIIGGSTIDNLNKSQEDRYHQVLVNLERWRWYPRKLGEQYILINISDFQLNLIKEGDTLGTYKTMVGLPSRQTPVFSDEIEYVIYNPTWTIPPTIEKKDVVPGMRRDRNYLKERSLNVYDKQNNRVDPSKIEWTSSEPYSYTYRQGPGPTNPLGQVKIIYPNKYMIYLHDTPHRELFNKRNRARSSGCVRVENALQLAKYLLNDQPKYDDEKIKEILDSGKTTEIPVTKKVSVHHFYWTAYPENDSIKFIDDIYDLDEELWQNLKPTGN